MIRSFECIGILDDSTNNMLNLSDVNSYVDSSEADGLLLFEDVPMAREWLEQRNCVNPDGIRPVKVTVTVDNTMLDLFPEGDNVST